MNQVTNSTLWQKSGKISKGVFFVCLMMAFLGIGMSLSFFGGVGVEKARASISCGALNSQNVHILNAPLNFNGASSVGGAEIEVIDSSALVAERNPSATDSNKIKPGSDQINIYVVRKGDSLSQIADMFDVTINTIVWANNIEHSSLIAPGQKLLILPISGVRYTVESGDTLAGIAKRYGGNVEEIKSYNNISGNSLITGEKVIIPNGEVSSPTPYTKAQYAAGGASQNSASDGYYMKPVRGGVISQWLHGHNAIDFAISYGSPVLAAASGEIIVSRDGGRWNGGYGNYVVIRHGNGTQTLYAHNSRNIVYVGQHVVKGQVIGYIGSTGHSTGPHVHFEVRGARNQFAR